MRELSMAAFSPFFGLGPERGAFATFSRLLFEVFAVALGVLYFVGVTGRAKMETYLLRIIFSKMLLLRNSLRKCLCFKLDFLTIEL